MIWYGMSFHSSRRTKILRLFFFFFLHSPYPDGPLIIIIIIIIFFKCMRLHVGSRRDRFMEAILLRQVACRCAGRAFGKAIVCLAGTWRQIGVTTTSIWRCIEVGATSRRRQVSAQLVGHLYFLFFIFFPQTIF